jgi:DNA-binding protein HU-beta
MNKSELIKALAESTNGTQIEAKAFLEAFTDTVGDVLKSGDKITLVGFGTFAE